MKSVRSALPVRQSVSVGGPRGLVCAKTNMKITSYILTCHSRYLSIVFEGIGLLKLGVDNWFERLGRCRNLQEACRINSALRRCQKDFMVPSHDQPIEK